MLRIHLFSIFIFTCEPEAFIIVKTLANALFNYYIVAEPRHVYQTPAFLIHLRVVQREIMKFYVVNWKYSITDDYTYLKHKQSNSNRVWTTLCLWTSWILKRSHDFLLYTKKETNRVLFYDKIWLLPRI